LTEEQSHQRAAGVQGLSTGRSKSEQEAALIVGSIAIDSVRTPLGEVEDQLGGAAVYSSVAATFFAPVRLVGVVGEDFPSEHLVYLSARGVDLAGVQRASGKTFRWKGYYDFDLNQAHSLSTELNVFETFTPRLPEEYRSSRFVMLANIDPDLQLDVLDQVADPLFTICDTMNYWIESKKDRLQDVFRRVNAVIINDAEARQLCNTFSLVEAARQLQALGPELVIIKKGEHGAMMFHRDSVFVAPPFPLLRVTDPTGAGDTFAGALIGYLSRARSVTENTIRQAVVYGSVLASFNIENFGIGRLKSLTLPEIHDRYRELRHASFFEDLSADTWERQPGR
jgi:sugar/nucleoside kinase (ribokinase family)